MPLIFLNGELRPPQEALISVFDRGFLYGDGVFETLRAYRGTIFQLEPHLERLRRSAASIRLSIPYDDQWLSRALYSTLRENGLRDACLRLTVSRGTAFGGLAPQGCGPPTVVIIPRGPSSCDPDLYRTGAAITIAQTRRVSPLALDPEIKSLNFLNNILAKEEGRARGCFEAVMLNERGHLCEGTVSNIFFVQGEGLKTPSREAGLLAGITRRVVLEVARENGIPCEEGLYPPDTLLEAEEVFLTNTGIELLPVGRVEDRSLPLPGKLTHRLRALFRSRLPH